VKYKEIIESEAQVWLHSYRIRAMVNGSRIMVIEIIEKEQILEHPKSHGDLQIVKSNSTGIWTESGTVLCALAYLAWF
jgi:hypothetical protein